MTKVTKGADQTIEVKAGDKTITIAKPGILARLAFMKAIGDQPMAYMSMLSVAAFVKSIDGEDILPAKSEAAALAIIGKIGDDGFDALTEAVNKHFAPPAEADFEADVKNS